MKHCVWGCGDVTKKLKSLNWDRKNIKGFQSCHPLDRGTGVLEREKLVVCWGIRGIRGMGGIGGIGLELWSSRLENHRSWLRKRRASWKKMPWGPRNHKLVIVKPLLHLCSKHLLPQKLEFSAQDGLGWAGMTAEPWQRKRQRSSQGTKSGLIWILWVPLVHLLTEPKPVLAAFLINFFKKIMVPRKHYNLPMSVCGGKFWRAEVCFSRGWIPWPETLWPRNSSWETPNSHLGKQMVRPWYLQMSRTDRRCSTWFWRSGEKTKISST